MYYSLALLFVIVTALLPKRGVDFTLPNCVRRWIEHPLLMPVAVIILLLDMHVYALLIRRAAEHQTNFHPYFSRMPVLVLNDYMARRFGSAEGDSLLILSVVATLTLAGLYLSLRHQRPWQKPILFLSFLLACTDAASSRAATSADMYSYVGFSLLGHAAYLPPVKPFAAPYDVINKWWGLPMVPAPYGPLWLYTQSAVASMGHDLYAKILALRIFGALTLAAMIGILALSKVPGRVLSIIALNPFFIFQFVANVHNDLFGLLMLLGADLCMRRRSHTCAVLLTTAAALVKLPFIILGAFAFTSAKMARSRMALFVTSAVLTIAVSYVSGGPAYFEAVIRHADIVSAGHPISLLTSFGISLKLLACCGVILALVGGVIIEGFAWSLPGIAAAFFPWYLSWPLAYGRNDPASLRNIAIALPMVAAIVDVGVVAGRLVNYTSCIILIALALSAFVLILKRLSGRPTRRQDYLG